MPQNLPPKHILPNASLTLRSSLCPAVQDILHEARTRLAYKVYVVAQPRGFCHYGSRTIVIPKWVCTIEKQAERQWYVSHEIAHAFVYEKYGDRARYTKHPDKVLTHGQEFMTELKRICPPEYLHFETGYKPRNARTAGISEHAAVNNMQAGIFPADF